MTNNKQQQPQTEAINPATDKPVRSVFLPDFCTIRMVFTVVIIAELFAIILAFYPLGIGLGQRWESLAMSCAENMI